MKKYLVFVVAMSVLGLTACMKSGNTVTGQSGDPQPGQLQLVAMKGLGKTSASVRATDTSRTYVFDLDTANSSIEQYFLLQNTGNYDVKNVTLTTNNPNFYFIPSKIEVVPPSKSSTIMQLVKLRVVHGTQINGVGSAGQLPMGENTATAVVAGTTSNANHDSIPVSQAAELNVYAKIFDVDFFAFDTVPVIMSRSNFNGGTYGGISGDMLRGYYAGVRVDTVRVSTPTLKIVNSGNASFKATVYYSISGVAVASDSMEVAPGGDMSLSFAGKPGAPLVQIDGHGVVANSEKLWLQPSVNAATNGKFTGIFFPSTW